MEYVEECQRGLDNDSFSPQLLLISIRIHYRHHRRIFSVQIRQVAPSKSAEIDDCSHPSRHEITRNVIEQIYESVRPQISEDD